MRDTNGITLLTFLLMRGIAGGGAHLISSSRADVVDPCHGYAICR